MMRMPGLWPCLVGVATQILFTLAAMFILVHWDEQGRVYVWVAVACLAVACAAVVVQVRGLGRFAEGLGHSGNWRWLALASLTVWAAPMMLLALWVLWITRNSSAGPRLARGE